MIANRLSLLTLLLLICMSGVAQDSQLLVKLKNLNGLSEITKVESSKFEEKYEVFISQELDQVNANAGKFNQRIIVCHRDFDRPTVIVTEGYEGERYFSPTYIDELASLFNTHIVVL